MLAIRAILLGTSKPGAISGGDRYALEIWKSWSERMRGKLTLTVSDYGFTMLRRLAYDLPSDVVATTVATDTTGRWVERCLRATARLLRVPSPAIVYACSPYFYDFIPAVAVALRSSGRSRIVTSVFHRIPPPWRRAGSFLPNLLAWVEQDAMIAAIKIAGAFVVTDNVDVRTSLVRRGIRYERIVVSSMGFRRVETNVRLHPVAATFVGRLTVQKGVDVLLRAWRSVNESEPKATLRLVGSRDPTLDVDGLLEELGLASRVEVIDDASDEIVAAALLSTVVFASASVEEGYGLSILEALAYGKAVVTFDVPVFREAFPVGRFVARERSPASFAAAMLEALRDEARRQDVEREIAALSIPSWDDVASQLWERVCT